MISSTARAYISPNGNLRERFREKYMAANMFTIIPVKGLNLSFGNSIIYSDQNDNPAYFIPVFFYKSVDHTLTSYKIENQNSQMFLDISLRLIKHTHFFLTAYWDDFALSFLILQDKSLRPPVRYSRRYSIPQLSGLLLRIKVAFPYQSHK